MNRELAEYIATYINKELTADPRFVVEDLRFRERPRIDSDTVLNAVNAYENAVYEGEAR